MNFKKPKEQVAADAAMAAKYRIQNNLQNLHNGSMSTIGYTVTDAIADGIRVAILSMIEDVYTDQEFEEDLNLRPKS